MEPILHLTTTEAWEAAIESGAYRGDTLDSEGFVHCSTQDQIRGVADALFAGRDGIVLLEIDPARVRAEIRYEAPNGSDERFPHVYGEIPVEAIVEAVAVPAGADGLLVLP